MLIKKMLKKKIVKDLGKQSLVFDMCTLLASIECPNFHHWHNKTGFFLRYIK